MELFNSLLDDETLFQRPQSEVASVVADYRNLVSAYGSLLATLVVPDRRLTEVARQLPAGVSVPVSVIITGGAGGLLALARHNLPRVDLVSAESALRDFDDLAGSAARVVSAAAELGPEAVIFVQLPYTPGWEAAVELIEAAGLLGKIAVDQAEPRQIAEQLSVLIEADLPFKITSFLDGSWFGLLAAVDALIDGASVDDAADLMRRGDQDRAGVLVSAWDQTTQSRVRRRVRRFGTARVQDMINQLRTHGGLAAP